MPTQTPIITLKQVSFGYHGNDYDTLSDISLSIEQGQCIGLIGPNGAGKSTLISLITGLLNCRSGEISYSKESELSQTQFIKQYLALVPQEYAFYEGLTVAQNLNYFSSLIGPKVDSDNLAQIIESCQLQTVTNKAAKALSGGYKRRLNLAIALLKKPKILILDEPTVGIDPVSRSLILSLLEQLKNSGTTIIYTSHLLSEVDQLCDRVYGLKQGKLIHIDASRNTAPLVINFAEPLNDDMLKQLQQQFESVRLINCQKLEIPQCEQPMMVFNALKTLTLPQIDEINFSKIELDTYYQTIFSPS